MSHLFTLLVGGLVIPGEDQADVSAIGWAGYTVITLGSDEDVMASSRGDSHLIDLRGAVVVPLDADEQPHWPVHTALEVGGPADLAVLSGDPRADGAQAPADAEIRTLALVRGGRVVYGELPPELASFDTHRSR